MKITIYELLGLVKDGKAPKKIKYSNAELVYNEGCEDYYSYYGNGLFEYKFGNCKNFLNGEVEIIEEPKDNSIERLDIEENAMTRNERYIRKEDNKFVNLSVADYELAKKINEIIDEINNLKEKK